MDWAGRPGFTMRWRVDMRNSGIGHRLGVFSTGISLVLFLAVCAAATLSVRSAEAATQYVTDTLSVGLRTSDGDRYDIIKYLKSDDPVEVLEESEAAFKVRTQDGLEGWLPKRYVTSETPSPLIIQRLRREVDRLKDKTGTVGELKSALAEKEGEAERLARELAEATEKYDTLAEQSRNVMEIAQERDVLLEENTKLKALEEILKDENMRLKRTSMIWWFLAGGGVFLVGWVVGKLSRQKRRY